MKGYARLMENMQSNLKIWGVVLGLLTLLSFFGASKLSLDGDLGRLLPDDAPSVLGLRKLEAVYGDQIGRLTVVLRPTQGDLQPVADSVGAVLKDVEGVQRVVWKDPRSELDAQRLLYMDFEDLEEIQTRLNRRIRWEKQRANPLFAELRSSGPPSVDVSDIRAKYPDSKDPYYRGESGEILVFVHPDFPAGDLDQTREFVKKVEQKLDAIEPPLDYALTGRYQKRVDQQDILTTDIVRATPAALIAILIFLAVYFRSFVTVAMVVTPLIVGTAAGMALAGVVFGSLNILTGFLGAVLMGLGVDYGIHLVSRFLDTRRTGAVALAAWSETFRTSGRASIYSGLTTILALASLSTSSFRAFYEFGIVASMGIFLILVSYAVLLPFLIFVLDRKNPKSPLSSVVGEKVGPLMQTPKLPQQRLLRVFQAIYVLLIVGIVGGIGLLKFDKSFNSLVITDTPTWHLDEMVNSILGQSQTPAVVLVDSTEHRDRVIAELEARRQKAEGYTLGPVLSTQALLPTQQDEKIEILKELKEKLEDVPEASRSSELVDFLKEIQGVVEAGPVDLKTLPDSLRVPFSRRDSDQASVVLVMPAVSLDEAINTRDFTTMLKALPAADGGTTDAIIDAMLLIEIMEFVERDTEWMVEITLFGLILVALIAFRFTWDAVRVVVFLIFTMGTALALLGLEGQEFNFINIMILPIWLGLGVDASFHMLVHIREHPKDAAMHITTLVSIAAAFITTMIGFGALIMSHHVGLASLGKVAVIGFTTMLVVNIIIGLDLSIRAARRAEGK
jgi:predicted RND superfamily exporter protein